MSSRNNFKSTCIYIKKHLHTQFNSDFSFKVYVNDENNKFKKKIERNMQHYLHILKHLIRNLVISLITIKSYSDRSHYKVDSGHHSLDTL